MELVTLPHKTSQATVITWMAAAGISALPPQAGTITASLSASNNGFQMILHPLLPLWKSETQEGDLNGGASVARAGRRKMQPLASVVRSGKGFRLLEVQEGKETAIP